MQEGSGVGVIIASGNSNQVGRIAAQTSGGARLTTLQIELNRFVLIIGSFSIIMGGIVVAVGAAVVCHTIPVFSGTAVARLRAVASRLQ